MRRFRERVFPILAGGLYLWFLILDLTRWGDSTWVKFAAICLCLLASLTGLGTADGRLVALALCLTVGADWFLLVLDSRYEAGVTLFLVVQLLYAYRLYRHRGGWISRYALFRLAGLAALIVSALSGRDIFPALSLFYFSNLAANACESALPFVTSRPSDVLNHPLRNRFSLGLCLFVACDLCVGGWNLGVLPGFTRVGMWLFYLPSQVLIVLSQQMKGDPYETF